MPRANRHLFLLAFAILVMFQFTKVNGQSSGEDTWGSWFMYFGTNTISDRLSIHSEAQFRYYEFADNFNQLLLRTGLNYHINPAAIATLGYGYILTDPSFQEEPGGRDSRENRIFQQFILKDALWKLGIEHRYRLEQRFLRSGSNTDIEHRARYRLQLTLPLNDNLFLNFYDEIFLNLQGEVFGQNRAYAALGIKVSANASIQLGYLKNHFPGQHFNRFQLGIFYNPDLRKKAD